MELDRGRKFEARLSRTVLFEIEVWLELEAVLTSLDECADDVRVTLDLFDVGDSFLRYICSSLFLEEDTVRS